MMKLSEKLKLLRELKAALHACDTAKSALDKLKAVQVVITIRQRLKAAALPELVLPEGASRREMAKAVEVWLKTNLQGKTIKASNGLEIRFNSKQSIKHLTFDSRQSVLAAKAIQFIADVFQTGEYGETGFI